MLVKGLGIVSCISGLVSVVVGSILYTRPTEEKSTMTDYSRTGVGTSGFNPDALIEQRDESVTPPPEDIPVNQGKKSKGAKGGTLEILNILRVMSEDMASLKSKHDQLHESMKEISLDLELIKKSLPSKPTNPCNEPIKSFTQRRQY